MAQNTQIKHKKVTDTHARTHQSLLIACVRIDSNISGEPEFKQNVEKSLRREGERDGGEERGEG